MTAPEPAPTPPANDDRARALPVVLDPGAYCLARLTLGKAPLPRAIWQLTRHALDGDDVLVAVADALDARDGQVLVATDAVSALAAVIDEVAEGLGGVGSSDLPLAFEAV